MSTTVHLEIQVDESRLADVADVLAETLQATRAFAGNEGLEVLVDDADPARMVVVEQWASTADHDAYVAWRATPEGRAPRRGAGRAARHPRVQRAHRARAVAARTTHDEGRPASGRPSSSGDGSRGQRPLRS